MSQPHDGAFRVPWRLWRRGNGRDLSAGRRCRARSFERKKTRPRWVESLERVSPLRLFFTGGVEYDAAVDPDRLLRFIDDFRIFASRLRLSPFWGDGVELKFRKLGRHRAEGLYYPDCRVLVLDVGSTRSFAHEFGHLVDFRASRGQSSGLRAPMASRRNAFLPFHDALLARMLREGRGDPRLSGGRGRCSWQYFSSAAECFARAFEQWAAGYLPVPSSLVREPDAYRSDVLFYREIPEGLAAFFSNLLSRGPEGRSLPVDG